MIQETLVLGVLFTVQVEAFCSLDWCNDRVAKAIDFFDVVHEVDVRCEAVHTEIRLIPIYDAESKRKLVRLYMESIRACRIHCISVYHLRILGKRLREEQNEHFLGKDDDASQHENDGAASSDEGVVLRLLVQV